MFEGKVVNNRLIWRAGTRKESKGFGLRICTGVYEGTVCSRWGQSQRWRMYLGTAEEVLEKIKNGMPGKWVRMIEWKTAVREEGILKCM